jgi:hypothetical protein
VHGFSPSRCRRGINEPHTATAETLLLQKYTIALAEAQANPAPGFRSGSKPHGHKVQGCYALFVQI